MTEFDGVHCIRCGHGTTVPTGVCVPCAPTQVERRKLELAADRRAALERRAKVVAEVKRAVVVAFAKTTEPRWRKQCRDVDAETGKRCSLLEGHLFEHSASGRVFTNPLAAGARPRRELELYIRRGAE